MVILKAITHLTHLMYYLSYKVSVKRIKILKYLLIMIKELFSIRVTFVTLNYLLGLTSFDGNLEMLALILFFKGNQ